MLFYRLFTEAYRARQRSHLLLLPLLLAVDFSLNKAIQRLAYPCAAAAAATAAPAAPAVMLRYIMSLSLSHTHRLAEAHVEGLVRQALTTRALLVKALRRPPTYLTEQQQQQQHKIKHQAAAAAAVGPVGVPRRIIVGVVVDGAAALRAVDVGPPADDAAAAGRFRALWGDKSELRRWGLGFNRV